MMYPRLKILRDLLKEDGVIFVSIDDNELTNLKQIMDDIFGNNNFLGYLPRLTKKGEKSSDSISKNNDFVIVYSKNENITPKKVKH